jgi:hypothetical protein
MMETAEQEYQDVMSKKRIVANDKKKIEVGALRSHRGEGVVGVGGGAEDGGGGAGPWKCVACTNQCSRRCWSTPQTHRLPPLLI